MDFGKSFLPDHPVIHTWSRCSLGPLMRAVGFTFTGPATTPWPTANKAIFYPFHVNRPFLVKKLFCYNGTTAAGNLDVGIYDRFGNRMVSSGSTAQAGTSVLQVFDVTDTWLQPGDYYFALAMDGTTGTIFRNAMTSTSLSKTAGMLEMASAFPLPATATFATTTELPMAYMGAVKRTVI